jgi:hypothetical protein
MILFKKLTSALKKSTFIFVHSLFIDSSSTQKNFEVEEIVKGTSVGRSKVSDCYLFQGTGCH